MKNEFIITIDDKYHVYKYVVNLSDNIAIYDIIKTICDFYKIETPEAIYEKKILTWKKNSRK